MHKIVEAGPSTQPNDSDNSLPAVASGDDEPSIIAEDCLISTSSLTNPEVGCSSTTLTPSQSYSTPLDIGILLNDGTLSTLSQSMKLKLLNHTPDVKYKYPTKYMNGCNRRFKPEWVQTHSWLHYSASEDGVFCKACILFAPSEVQQQTLGSLVSKPFSLWMKISSAFKSNEQLSYHQACMLKMTAFKVL